MDIGPAFLLFIACGLVLVGLGALIGDRTGQIFLLLGTVLAMATIVWLVIEVSIA